jgi:hypothetical protein
LAVAELSLAVHGGFAAPRIHDQLLSDAESALALEVSIAKAPAPASSRARPCTSCARR